MSITATIALTVAAATILPGAPLSDLNRAPEPRPWCDMAAHVARMQPLPTAEDPVFQRPTPANKARVGAVRKAMLGHKGKLTMAAAERLARRWRPIFSGSQGPALARLALSDASIKVRGPAMWAVRKLAAKHPRLAGFAGGDVRNPDPTIATIAGLLLMDSGCDTSASYALDALQHADASVRLAVALYTLRKAPEMADMGLVRRVLLHAAKGEKSASVRAAIAREAGIIGWQGAGAALTTLSKDPDEAVRAEAIVALARISGRVEPEVVGRLVAGKAPWSRVSAARAAAAGLVRRPRKARELLGKLLKDRRKARDPLGGSKTWRVSEAAKIAIAAIAGR